MRNLLLVISFALFFRATPATFAQQTNERDSSSSAITEYRLPADKLEKAHGLYIIETWLFLISTVYSFAVLVGFLGRGWMAKIRSLAERVSARRFVQAWIVIPLFALSFSVLLLPPRIYGHHVSRKFGLSVQGWGSWLRDWAVELLLLCIVGTLVAWILYSVIRRSPRRWWLYFWLAVVPISAFLTFIAPVVIDPLFNKFQPLENTHPELVSALEQVAHRGGLDIPRSRMYEMKASEKLTGSNAYVTGFGATKRVVVWDTAIQKMTAPEILFVFGHEMGHYVLGHIVQGFIFANLVFLVLFYLSYRIALGMQQLWGTRWCIRELADWASVPMLLLIISILFFVITPGLNAFSRHIEQQADQYGLEVVHGVVPDSPQVAAQSFQALGEEWLEYPYPSQPAVWWFWDHPTITDRIRFALSYDPWARGHS
jgi:Zn-dependent protease with chaperone function